MAMAFMANGGCGPPTPSHEAGHLSVRVCDQVKSQSTLKSHAGQKKDIVDLTLCWFLIIF